jgi:aspartyl-tRNA(Asn)/glutamyl-tRNA(Gln) amidotransferase subunit A
MCTGPVALCTDENGGARVAGAMCGVVALKPTFGRVSSWGVVPYAISSNHVSVIAQSSTDAAIAYVVISGQSKPSITTTTICFANLLFHFCC